MRTARLRRGLAVCLACCALLSGCSMGYTPISPTPADPVSAQAALDALERQVDLYAREIRVEEIDFARVPMIRDEEAFQALWELALERRVNRLAFVTEDEALTLPEGGSALAHQEGLQAVTPYVWQDEDGLYMVLYEITHYEGEHAAYAYLNGEEDSLTQREKRLLERALELLGQLDEGLEGYELLVCLHDLVRDAASYTPADLSENRLSGQTSAYGLLLEGRANCQGYADALQLLCLLSGLPCRKITGEVDGGPHVWNLVQVDGAWMHVDATFDDSFFGEELRAYVFLGTPEWLLAQTHSWAVEDVPGAVDEGLFYYARNGLILSAEERPPEGCVTFLYEGGAEQAAQAFPGYACREIGPYQVLSLPQPS